MNLKQKLSKKLKKTGGFTLIEMLIVVAIIAILVAVSIPMVSGALDKARQATDDANERAAKAVATISAIEGKLNGAGGAAIKTTDTEYYYDISEGELVEGTTALDTTDYGQSKDNKDRCIQVTFKADTYEPTISWQETTITTP